ncbi:MAG TPA: phage holin family protein [Caldimonas sp.]|nr:phage holin family protein [Caldimonas sp.]
MIHPLLRLVATQPQLLGDHVEAYAELVGDELRKTSSAWATRLALYAAALCLLCVGLVLTGVALMLWASLPAGSFPTPWVLVAVPAVTLVAAGVCAILAKQHPVESAFDKVKQQLDADMAILREVSVP